MDEKCPAYFYPDATGLILQYDGITRTDKVALSKTISTVSFNDFTEYKGVPVWIYEFKLGKAGGNGESAQNKFSVVQQVDNNVSQTKAFKFSTGKMKIEEVAYVDLKAPLIEGATWQFKNWMLYYKGKPGTKIEYVYNSSVEKTGVSVSTAAGTFENCTLIREQGRSVQPVIISCSDGTPVKTRIEVDRYRYWAPSLGCIKETSSERYIIDSSPAEACSTFFFSSELIKIVAIPERVQ